MRAESLKFQPSGFSGLVGDVLVSEDHAICTINFEDGRNATPKWGKWLKTHVFISTKFTVQGEGAKVYFYSLHTFDITVLRKYTVSAIPVQ